MDFDNVLLDYLKARKEKCRCGVEGNMEIKKYLLTNKQQGMIVFFTCKNCKSEYKIYFTFGYYKKVYNNNDANFYNG